MMMNFPKHECGLYLNHNDHKSVYESASDWVIENEMYEFESEEEKQRCINTGEIWTLQWYPNTPVGFNAVAASTLGALLRFANAYNA